MINPVINAASFFFNIVAALPLPLYNLILWSWVLGAVALVVHVFVR